jgi:hypothetical protein
MYMLQSQPITALITPLSHNQEHFGDGGFALCYLRYLELVASHPDIRSDSDIR